MAKRSPDGLQAPDDAYAPYVRNGASVFPETPWPERHYGAQPMPRATYAAMVSRLDPQKGLDIVGHVVHLLMNGQAGDAQFNTGGEMIDAEEAHRIGLVNRVVPADQLLDAAREMLRQMLANGPVALAHVIEAVNQGLEASLDDGLLLEANQFGLLAATEDMREGTAAFLAKRPAQDATRKLRLNGGPRQWPHCRGAKREC